MRVAKKVAELSGHPIVTAPNKAEIVIKKGETGGTRYLLRPEKKN